MDRKTGVLLLVVVAILLIQVGPVTEADHISADEKAGNAPTCTKPSRSLTSDRSFTFNETRVLDPSNPPNYYGDFDGSGGVWGMYADTAFVITTVNWTLVWTNNSLPSVSVYIFNSSDDQNAWIESGGTSQDYSAMRSSIPDNGTFTHAYSPRNVVEFGVFFKNDDTIPVTVIYNVTVEQQPSKCWIMIASTIQESSLGARVSFTVTVRSDLDINYTATVEVPDNFQDTIQSFQTYVDVGTQPSLYQPATIQTIASWPNYLQKAISFELTPHRVSEYPDLSHLKYNVDWKFSAYIGILLVTNEVLNSSYVVRSIYTPQLTPGIQSANYQEIQGPYKVQITGNNTYGTIMVVFLDIEYETSSPMITPVLFAAMLWTAGGSVFLVVKWRKGEWVLLQNVTSFTTMILELASSPNVFEASCAIVIAAMFLASLCYWSRKRRKKSRSNRTDPSRNKRISKKNKKPSHRSGSENSHAAEDAGRTNRQKLPRSTNMQATGE